MYAFGLGCNDLLSQSFNKRRISTFTYSVSILRFENRSNRNNRSK